MNENEEILLQEYAEGTLDERYRADVVALLARSPPRARTWRSCKTFSSPLPRYPRNRWPLTYPPP